MLSLDRRSFLAASAALPFAGNLRSQDPAFPGMIVRMAEPRNLEMPFASLADKIVPNDRFFVRSHFAVPKIEMSNWKLSIEGAVEKPFSLTHEELLKLPTRSKEVTIECAGNNRVALVPQVPGLQWGSGAVGNAKWTGVPLAALLEKAGIKNQAVEVLLIGADKGIVAGPPSSPGPIHFDRSIPIAKAKSTDVLIAHQMNDSKLNASHGFPARAVVAGWYGMSSVKWLTRIVVLDKAYRGFWQTLDYSFWRRMDGSPTLVASSEMLVKALIARPSLGDRVPAGNPCKVLGAAWAGEHKVAKVEFSWDEGKSWKEAKLLDKTEPHVWSRWEYTWDVEKKTGPVKLLCKATDEKGNSQPTERDPDRRTYMINHLMPIEVEVV